MKKLILITLFLINCSILYAREHPYFVGHISCSPNGRYIAIGRMDKKIVILDREKEKVVKVIESKLQDISVFTAFTSDSKCFVFFDKDYYLDFYDLEKREITRRIKLDDNISAIAFFKDMKKMIWGGLKGKVEVVDLETQEKQIIKKEYPLTNYMGYAPIHYIVISPDEKYFLTITRTFNFELDYDEPEEDMRPGMKKDDYSTHPYDVKHIGVNLWDSKTFKKINKFMADDLSGYTGAAFSLDGKYIVITSESGVTVWDLDTLKILYSVHVMGDTCGFVDKNSEYFVVLLPGHRKLRLYRLQDIVNPKEPIIIIKEDLKGKVYKLDEKWEDLIKNGYIDEKGVVFEKFRNVRGPRDLNIKANSSDKLSILGVLGIAMPDQMKMIKLKRWPCSWAMVTDPDRNLIITGDVDGSISVYKFDPKKLEIKLAWHPKSIIAGVIRFLDPIEVMFSSKEEIEEMTKKYEINQLRIIEEERKKGTVETKYETIKLPEEKQKDQKPAVSTLTPVK